jgi:hypothetical protein
MCAKAAIQDEQDYYEAEQLYSGEPISMGKSYMPGAKRILCGIELEGSIVHRSAFRIHVLGRNLRSVVRLRSTSFGHSSKLIESYIKRLMALKRDSKGSEAA